MNLEQLKEWQRTGHESLSAQMMPETINAENRTVDIVWFTGIDVPRMNLWTGEPYTLRFDPKGVDLSRLNAGAAVLDNHNNESGVAGQMGVVEKAWVDGTNYKATLRFSKRPEVDGVWRDIQDKIIQKFSMGAEILAKQDIAAKGDTTKTILATKWRPNEISMSNIPADFGTTTLSAIEHINAASEPVLAVEDKTSGAPAQPNKEIQTMSEQLNDNVAGVPAAPPVVVDETKLQAARQSEKLRAKEIRNRVSAAKLSSAFADELIDSDTSVDLASERIFAELAKQPAEQVTTKGHHSAAITHDKGDKIRETMSAALLHRYEPVRYQAEAEAAREWSGFSLREMARECVTFKGTSVRGKGIDEVVQLAISTSDLPNILIDVANKTLRAGYENYPNTFQPFTKRGTATDFKTIYRTQLSGAPALLKVNEHGEIQQGSLTDSKESFSLATYARILSITRKTIINDDLSALTRVPELMGRKAAILEGDIVWAKITANAAMADGVALFHATHGNLGTTAALGVDTIGELQSKMTLQTGLEGDKLNLMPKYLAAPVALRLTLQKLYSGIYPATISNTVPEAITALQPIFEPRLDSNSATAFYVFADPSSVDTIEYCYLEGQEGMYFETQMGFEVDGVKFKARHDFGAGVIDYRGMAKNIGA
jgi:hypothetical protein